MSEIAARRRTNQLHRRGPARAARSSLHQLNRHDAGPVAAAGPRARRHLSRHPIRRSRARVVVGASRQLLHRATRARRARDPRRGGRAPGAHLRHLTGRADGDVARASMRLTASRASCSPIPPPASAPSSRGPTASRWCRSAACAASPSMAMPAWFSPGFRQRHEDVVTRFKIDGRDVPADRLPGLLRGAAGRGSCGRPSAKISCPVLAVAGLDRRSRRRLRGCDSSRARSPARRC